MSKANVVEAPIERMMARTKRIASGQDPKVRPGQHERFTDACTVNDTIRQGDLYLIISAKVPEDYKKAAAPKNDEERNKLMQLVPGNTTGARHCLDSLDGVEVYYPPVWNDEVLTGPFLVLTADRTVQHPTHGHVTLKAGTTVECLYQREHDKEMALEQRRNRD